MLSVSAGALIEFKIALQDFETFAETLIVYDFAFAQEVQWFDDLRVDCYVHAVLIDSADF